MNKFIVVGCLTVIAGCWTGHPAQAGNPVAARAYLQAGGASTLQMFNTAPLTSFYAGAAVGFAGDTDKYTKLAISTSGATSRFYWAKAASSAKIAAQYNLTVYNNTRNPYARTAAAQLLAGAALADQLALGR